MISLRKPSLLIVLCVVLLLPLVLWGSRVQAGEEETYLIGQDDLLDVTVWGAPDLTKEITVESDGNVNYPLLGRIAAVELTLPQLEEKIRAGLAQGYVKDPKVTITVKEYNSKKVLVFGEVGKPGLYKIKQEVPVLELLFMVGGGKPDAKRMTVIRPAKATGDTDPAVFLGSVNGEESGKSSNTIEIDLIALLSKGDLSQNVLIYPGDTVYVASGTGERYYVLGQVIKPGPYEWVQEITVLEAIKMAGGGTERAALNRIKVRRGNGAGPEFINVNMVDIMKGKKKDDVIIKAGDTVIVPESWV